MEFTRIIRDDTTAFLGSRIPEINWPLRRLLLQESRIIPEINLPLETYGLWNNLSSKIKLSQYKLRYNNKDGSFWFKTIDSLDITVLNKPMYYIFSHVKQYYSLSKLTILTPHIYYFVYDNKTCVTKPGQCDQ